MLHENLINGFETAKEQIDNWGCKEEFEIVKCVISDKNNEIYKNRNIFVRLTNNKENATIHEIHEFLLSEAFIEIYTSYIWDIAKKSKNIKRKVVFPEPWQLLYDEILPLQRDIRNTIYDVIYNKVNNWSLESFFKEIITGA